VLRAQFADQFVETIQSADPFGETVDVALDVGREWRR